MKMQNSKLFKIYIFSLLFILPNFVFACMQKVTTFSQIIFSWYFLPPIIILIVSVVAFIRFRKNKYIRLLTITLITLILSGIISLLAWTSIQNKQQDGMKCVIDKDGRQACFFSNCI